MEGPTVAIVTLLKIDGDPNRIKEALPTLEHRPPARFQDTADEEELEPVLDPGEG